jgi:FdhE protein
VLEYLAPEGQYDSRRVLVCSDCRGYVKAVATLTPIRADALLERDLATVELDVAALERGYCRPLTNGFHLDVRLAAA